LILLYFMWGLLGEQGLKSNPYAYGRAAAIKTPSRARVILSLIFTHKSVCYWKNFFCVISA